MIKKNALLVAAIFMVAATWAQAPANIAAHKKPSLLGIAYSLTNFNIADGFGSNAVPDLAVKDLAHGASVYYWKGLSSHIDLSLTANAIFYNYGGVFQGKTTDSKYGFEFQPALNFRLLSDEKAWSPFLTAGIGGGVYSGKTGGFVPLGGGMQFNVHSSTYFLLQCQYKLSLSKEVLGHNLAGSFGIAKSLTRGQHPGKKLPAAPTVNNDTDGDGVLNDVDECPDVKGVAALKGCPDRDGDGLADKDDKCPDQKGLGKYNGCPIPDTDKDGINDEEDKCKDEPGLARYQGCPVPDTDKDGINDEEDRCKDVAGVASNMGCPEIARDVVALINRAAARIYFTTAGAKLLPGSIPALNKIVTILKEHPDYMLDINGYTDNQGNPERNRLLSEARANAINDYFIKKGIDAARLSAAGFGEENPVADNKTAAGRAKNRRVEIKVRNY